MINPVKENPLKELEAFHQLAQLIFVSLDIHGRICYINPQGSRMLGYKQEELIGLDWFQTCLPPDYAEELRSKYEHFIETGGEGLEFYQNPVLTRGGERKVYSWHNMPRRGKHGGYTGVYATGMDITDLVHSGQREQYLGKVLEYALNEIYIADADSWQLLYANKIAQHNIGYQETNGLHLGDLPTPESAELFSQHLQRISLSLESSPRFELRLLRRNGSSYPVEAIVFRSHYRLSPAIVVYAQDISRRQQAQNQLALSESKFQLILDTAAEGIVTLNLRGEIESFNRAAEALFGFTPAQALGKQFSTLLTDEDRDKYKRLEQAFLAPELTAQTPARIEVQVESRSGNVLEVEIAFARSTSPAPLVILVVHDLTQRKAAEMSLRERERELVNLREQLYHSQRLNQMNALANGIAHEINQPLAAINTYAETAQQFANSTKDATAEIIHALEQIGSQARRAGEVINALRQMLKKQKGKRDLVELNNLITATVELIRPELKEHAIKVNFDSAESQVLVIADPIQIQQVLLNLLQNSVDSLKQVGADNRQILVVTEINRNDNGVENAKCIVRDNGVGVEKKRQANIFRPFTSTKENGLGMGLTICKDIINSHNGELAINSSYTGGSEFYFTLPSHQND